MRYATVSQVQAHGSMHMNDIIHEINTVKIGHADLCLVTIKSLRCRKFELHNQIFELCSIDPPPFLSYQSRIISPRISQTEPQTFT